MEIKDFGPVSVQLEQQHAILSAKADSLRAELATLVDLLTRIEGAKAALNGPTPCIANAALIKKEKRKAVAPSVSKAQVIEFMLKELSQNKLVHESQLKSRIEQVLVDSGYSRSGYSLRFKEACSDSRFQSGPNGISLTQPGKVTPSAAAPSTNGHERINA